MDQPEQQDTRVISALLGLCASFERTFTLPELVDRVMLERPGSAFEFAKAWRHLVAMRRIQTGSIDHPTRYYVAGRRRRKAVPRDVRPEA
jgi:hypothetical protein